jgi:transcriptional regulator with XRE-family HTH domain
MRDHKFPYRKLGAELRKLRQEAQETLLDVSAAVEVETQYLMRIEAGVVQPSEDILILLMNHFDVDDKQALFLWQQANYIDDKSDASLPTQVFIMPFADNKVYYSDQVSVSTSKSGDVVVSFFQPGADGKPVATTRVGMNQSTTQELVRQLSTINQAKKVTKLLPTKTTTEDTISS